MSQTATDQVIGSAGAAGLEAARAARGRGIDTLLPKAGNRIGGRAGLESETFGTRWNPGRQMLPSAGMNPLGMDTYPPGFTPWHLPSRSKFAASLPVKRRLLDRGSRENAERR